MVSDCDYNRDDNYDLILTHSDISSVFTFPDAMRLKYTARFAYFTANSDFPTLCDKVARME